MNPNADNLFGLAVTLEDIEHRVSEIFSAQKSEVEQSLVERINREKEEAQKRIEAVNQEFAQIRGFIDSHKTAMTELQTVEEHLRGEIRGHFERAVNYQKMMEHAAVLAGGELERIGGLNEELEKLRSRAESEYASFKSRLSGYAGIVAKIPAPVIRAGGEVDWNEEIGKLRKVRDLLATLRQAAIPEGEEADAVGAAAEPAPSAPAAETAEELAASLGLIGVEEDGVKDDTDFAHGDRDETGASCAEAGTEVETPAPIEAAPAPETAGPEPMPEPEPEIPADGCQYAAPAPEPAPPAGLEKSEADARVQETLARYRRSEPVNSGIEIGFYASEAGAFLDADSFMAAIGKIMDAASQLHGQLGQTSSVKDLFLLKQEILNQQEVLRKLFFRVVRFSEKEGGRLPAALDEIVGSKGLKDIIERLTMANWSDPSDFKPFLNELNSLERAFETRAGSLASHLRSVLDEVEGREN